MLLVAVAWVHVSAAKGSGATAAATAAQQASPGDRLLLQAAAQLERRQSVNARIAHRVSINGAQFSGRGRYLQQNSGEDVRIRMELHIAGPDASLLQVCNSRYVWFDWKLPSGRTLTQIDLRQLRSDPVLAEASLGEVAPGQASWSAGRPDSISQLSGLPKLFVTLTQNFSFLPPQAMRLVSANAPPETSVPFFAVVGRWRPEKLAMLLEHAELAAELSKQEGAAAVPSHIPFEVLMLFGQADLFPYRVEYRGLETPPAASAGAPVPFQLSTKPMVVLEFSNVVFDAPIAASDFDYTPLDVNWVDNTATVLERLRQERQAKVASRAANAPPAEPAR
jgi:hypothetical protein